MPSFQTLKSEIIDKINDEYFGGFFGDHFKRLRYPLLEDEYQAEIIFTPLKTTPLNVDLLGENINGAVDLLGGIFSAGGLVGGSVTGQLRQTINQFSGIDFQADSKVMVEPVDDNYNITLYLPQQITFNNNINYNPLALNALGAVTEAALNAGAGGIGAVGAGIMGIGSQLLGNPGAAANSALARAGAAGLASRINVNVGGAFRRATQTSLNPNQRTLFENPIIREFSFQFKFIPTSFQEAKAIQKIVNAFKTEMYPAQIVAGDTGVAVAYEFPNKFDIKMKYKGNRIPGTEMLPCYLRGVQVTYNPTQMGMYEDGNFNETDLTLSFVEETALHKGAKTFDGEEIVGGASILTEVDIDERDLAIAQGLSPPGEVSRFNGDGTPVFDETGVRL